LIKIFVRRTTSFYAKRVNIIIFLNALATLTSEPKGNTPAAYFFRCITASSNCHETGQPITFAALPYFLP
jgi:hypothetical protein